MSRPATTSRTTAPGTISTPPRRHLVDTGRGHRWANNIPADFDHEHEGNPIKGLIIGCLLSLPMWALIIKIALR